MPSSTPRTRRCSVAVVSTARSIARLDPSCWRHAGSSGACQTGDAKATPGFELPARWVIHTVGPVWHGGGAGEPELLASCYRRSFEVARELGATSMAFPAISTGVYGYPIEPAARIAVDAIRTHGSDCELVRVVAFNDETIAAYEPLLSPLENS